MKNIFQKTSLLLIAALGLTACGGGGSSGSSSTPTSGNANGGSSGTATSSTMAVAKELQIRTPGSAYVSFDATDINSSSKLKAAIADSSCFAVLPSAGGKNYSTVINSAQYYSTGSVEVTIKNTCATPQAMSNVNINVASFLVNGSAAPVNWIGQSSGNPYLTVTYAASGNDLNIKASTPSCTGAYCDWALMPAGSTRVFTINTFANTYMNSLTVRDITITGGAPVEPALPGSLAVTVNSSSLQSLCAGSSTCHIGVNVLSPTGTKIDEIFVNPSESPVYTKTYTNLLIGSYSISVDPATYPSAEASRISTVYNPSTGIAQVNSSQTSNVSATLNYTAPQPIGNLVVNVGTVSEAGTTFSSIGQLSGSVKNTSTNVVTTFTSGLNGSTTLSNLPSGTYSVSVQGIADPATGVYYAPYKSTATVSSGKTITVNATFSKVSSGLHSVNFTVANAPTSQTVSYAGSSPTYKYNVNTLSNGTKAYSFLSGESAVALTINTPSGYTLSYSPEVVTSSTPTVTITYTANSTPTPPESTPLSEGALTTFNDQIVDSKGNVVKLKGVNWFGFNNGDMLNGMWNYDAISGDFANTVLRFKALGFNAVRLPFSFPLINSTTPPASYVHASVAGYPVSTATMTANLTNPGYSVVGKMFPTLAYNPLQTSSNQLLPNDTVLNRFMYVIDFFAKNGFYVLIDDHREDMTITQSVPTWVSDWKSLAATIYKKIPSSANRVMFDILNEPDGFGLNWSKMGPAYLEAMDAINTVTKGQNLFFIEGSGQGGINANWGDGFATNSTIIKNNGLSDPNWFFTQLAGKPYINQVVLSPHVYPPTVTNATADYSGAGLYNRLNTSFGDLAKTGYCVSVNNCHRFPIAFGEFGSFFADSRDFQFFTSFANYLNYTGDAKDGLHDPIDNWFYWSYNPNSGDTGGLVANNWIDVEWMKIDYLAYGVVNKVANSTNPNGLGLKPWYK